ncbi:hypothetical protein ANTQUA_LOCUS8449 [Anthophora quadrimaculata]
MNNVTGSGARNGGCDKASGIQHTQNHNVTAVGRVPAVAMKIETRAAENSRVLIIVQESVRGPMSKDLSPSNPCLGVRQDVVVGWTK